MFLFLLLSACTPDSTLGAALAARLDDARTEVADHRDHVDGASSMGEVDQMEADHHEAMTALMDEMSSMMASMMACGMSDSMMGGMTDADTHMGQMADEVTRHGETQAAHSDMGECTTEEDSYTAAMNEHMDAMRAAMEGFDTSATCPEGSGGMGMM